MRQKFEWDSQKDQANLKKHGIDFETAKFVFLDPWRLEEYDARHSEEEERFLTVGAIEDTVLVVVYTMRGRRIRLISARRATNKEEDTYYGNKKKQFT